MDFSVLFTEKTERVLHAMAGNFSPVARAPPYPFRIITMAFHAMLSQLLNAVLDEVVDRISKRVIDALQQQQAVPSVPARLSQSKTRDLLGVRSETLSHALKLPPEHPCHLPSIQRPQRGKIGGPGRLIDQAEARAWKEAGKDLRVAALMEEERAGKPKAA